MRILVAIIAIALGAACGGATAEPASTTTTRSDYSIMLDCIEEIMRSDGLDHEEARYFCEDYFSDQYVD